MNELRLYEACANKIKDCSLAKKGKYAAVALSVSLMITGCSAMDSKIAKDIEKDNTYIELSVSDLKEAITIIDKKPMPSPTVESQPTPSPVPSPESTITPTLNPRPTPSPTPEATPVAEPAAPVPTPERPTTTTNTSNPAPIVQLEAELQSIIETSIRFSNSSYSQIANYIDSIRVDYQYSELFNINAALAQYNNINRYRASSSSNFVTNNRINRERVRTQIINNNTEFLANFTGSRLSALSITDFDKVLTTFIDTLEYNLASGYIDMAKLDEKIQDLKILSTTEGKMAYVDSIRDIFAVNTNIIATRQARYPDIDYFKKIVIHESVHFIQMATMNEAEHEGYRSRFGISYDWEDMSINPLCCSWFHEGAADRIMVEMDNYNMTGATYPLYIRSINSLTLATMIRNDVDQSTLSQISFQNNLESLFTAFGCQNDRQRLEILQMMYSFEITHTANRDFYAAVTALNGAKMESSEKSSYEYGLKASQAQTLTKAFYTNLAGTLTSRSVKLEEVFHLISIFEADMSRLTWYSSRTNENRDFFNTYVGIQNQFFGRIASELGISATDITRAYNAYNSALRFGETNLSFLSDSENNYLTEISAGLRDNKRRAINEVFEQNRENIRER